MTQARLLSALCQLLDSAGRPDANRVETATLELLASLLPGDAMALLRLDGEWLVPLAVRGLVEDCLGRRFRIADHPRFQALLARRAPTRFPADSDLPDPYDGLVQGVSGQLEVHDCMGCPLYLGDRLWGLLTLDALSADALNGLDDDQLRQAATLVETMLALSQRVIGLQHQAERGEQLAETFRTVVDQERPRELVGRSQAHRRLMEEIGLVADSPLSVLISGETGVGKELVAQAIHRRSPRARQPLITINCAALPDTLVESELFGHVRGAFTGAASERRGKFELADGGTLFLDEVGELPMAAQAKLLRALQTGQLQRLGSDHEHQVDVRLIAATNRDLAEEVRHGRFRPDLYHRLAVYPLRVPALRERGRDVLLLAGTFLEENRARLGLRGLRLDRRAEAQLLGYDWPGNVRELEHLLARSALHAVREAGGSRGILTVSLDDPDLAAATASTAAADPPPAEDAAQTLRESLDGYQRQLLARTLDRCAGNWAEAARVLGTDRANLIRLAKRLGLR